MFPHDLTDLRKVDKRTAREAFEDWRKTRCPNPNAFSFELKKEFIKGKERVWHASMYGDYQDASRNYRRYVCYQCGLGNLTENYSWVWNEREQRWLECAVQKFGSW